MTTGDPATVRSVRISDDLHLAVLDRGGGRAMRLFSREARDYPYFDGLPLVENASAHLRRHPLTGEWIAYSAARQGRTMLPDAHDCPLCPMRDASRLTDVPVADYEVAIFSNRFAALLPDPGTPPELALPTRSGAGLCEVISYSADHAASLSSIGPDRIALLVDALADRVPQIMQNPDVAFVLPFENRGREIGVTLDHPHGQIYGLPHLPERIRQTAEGFRDEDPLADLASTIPDGLRLAENDTGIAFVPPWARYPFEVWVAPHERVPDMSRLDAAARADFASLLDIAAQRLDSVFETPMPYTFGWQLAPRGYEDCFHFHCVFQPLRRGRSKLKFLAGVEQFTGFFLVDLPPERAADILNGRAAADD